MNVKSIIVENLIGLKVISMKELGPIVKLFGSNGAGKSRIITAILAALKYDSLTPERKKLLLESTGKVQVELTDNETIKGLKITRHFKNGQTRLVVSGNKGMSGNAETIKSFVGSNFVDLNKFISLKPKDQIQAVLDMVGVSKQMDMLKQQRRSKYNERYNIGQIAKGINPGEKPEVNKTLPTLDEVSAKRKEIEASNEKTRVFNQELNMLGDTLKDREEYLRQAEDKIIKAQKELDKWKQIKITRERELNKTQEEYDTKYGRKECYVFTSSDEVDKLQTDANIRSKQEWLLKNWEENKQKKQQIDSQYNGISAEIVEIDKKMKDVIKKTVFPVDGLSYDGERLTMNGEPLASDGQFRVVAFAIAKKLAGDISIATFENFSLLDDKNQQSVIDDARKAGFQLFLELVGVKDEKDEGFFIQDGTVKENHATQKKDQSN